MNRYPYSRHSLRMPGYDYAATGVYYVTICTAHKECVFADVTSSGDMVLTACGHIVNEEWTYTPILRPYVSLDAYVVMPNHLHGLIVLQDHARVNARHALQSPSQTVGAVIRGFKAATTRRIRRLRDASDLIVWQRNYYEHIVRGTDDLERVRRYIQDNPARWMNHP